MSETSPLVAQSESAGHNIRPTGNPVSGQYSDIAFTSLFNAHVAIINSERQAIWQRYSAMIIANSIVLALASLAQLPSEQKVLFTLILGLPLCSIWYFMTVSGYRLFLMEVRRAQEFIWVGLGEKINPFTVALEYERGKPGGFIFRASLFVIAWFVLGYLYYPVMLFFAPST